MPQACRTRTPYRSSNARISAGGQAEPPTIACWRLEMSRSGFASRWWSRSFQIVGTAAALLIPSDSIIADSGSAWRNRSGMTMVAPVASPAYARPHEFAWNSGTIARTLSPSCRLSPRFMPSWRQCR
jgi:hypothetical protein